MATTFATEVGTSFGSAIPQKSSMEEHQQPAIDASVAEEEQRDSSPYDHKEPAIYTNMVGEEQPIQEQFHSSQFTQPGEPGEPPYGSTIQHEEEPAINTNATEGEHTVPEFAVAGAAARESCSIVSDVSHTPAAIPTLKTVAGASVADETAAAGNPPLSPEEVRQFEEDGFVMLKHAFDPRVAAAGREHLWRRLQAEGITKDPGTWVIKHHIAEIYGTPTSPKKRRGQPWTNAVSPRLKAAVDQLAGAGTWEMFGCGWWTVTFPGFAEPPWRADGKWHVDGAHFRHYPHRFGNEAGNHHGEAGVDVTDIHSRHGSREIGLLPIFLFSDVRPQWGGTALLRGSHKEIAKILWERAGTTGMKGPALSTLAREVLLPAPEQDIIETSGEAGDVMLTHPLLLHARSTNLAPEEESGVRFMCHPAVPLKHHLDFSGLPKTFSPMQRVLWDSRPRDGKSALRIATPEQCDHTPVHLAARGGCIRPSGKRSRSSCGTTADMWHRQKRRPSPVQDMERSLPAPRAEGPLFGKGSVCAEAVSEFMNSQTNDGNPVESLSLSVDHESSLGDVTTIVGDSNAEKLRSLSIDKVGRDDEVLAVMGFSGFGAGQ